MESDHRQKLDTEKIISSRPSPNSNTGNRIIGSDRLATARRLLIAMLLVTGVSVTAIAIDSSLRATNSGGAGISLFHSLGLRHPALVPSGRLLRHPEFYRSGVDLRFSPSMIRAGTDPALLILPYRGDGYRP